MNHKPLLVSLAMCLLFPAERAAAGSKSDEGVRLFESRMLAQARSTLEAAAHEDPKDARAASYLGRVLLATGEPDRSVEWIEKSVALEPANAEYHLWLGRAYGYQAIQASVLEQPAIARKVKREFEHASRLDPENLEARFARIEFYLRAPGILGGSLKKAEEQAQEIRKRDALQGYRASGRVAEHRKDFDRALAEYEQALREFPQKTEPFFWKGALYARKREYEKAFETYEKLFERDPSAVSACYQIGRLAALSGRRLERGEECLKLYLEREPSSDEPSLASAHYRLGLLYEKKGSQDLARREYSVALELEPSLAEVRDALLGRSKERRR